MEPHAPSTSGHAPRKRKNHRGGKKKKQTRRKSFAGLAPDDIESGLDQSENAAHEGFYSRSGRNASNTSIDSDALLDHREQKSFIRPRRPSMMTASGSLLATPGGSRLRHMSKGDTSEEDGEGAPLLSSSLFQRGETFPNYGSGEATLRRSGPGSRRESSRSSSKRRFLGSANDTYNVNYPPSVPGTPQMRPQDRMDMSFGDVLLRDELQNGESHEGDYDDDDHESFHHSPLERRKTIAALQAEEDVCFPQEGLSDIVDDDLGIRDTHGYRGRARRRRRKWPDIALLNEWSRVEKEGRSEERRVKKMVEPQLINGRLRPVHRGWFQAEEEAPYRFTYFNEEFPSTIHSQTIGELVQPGGSFKELFIPDPPILSDSSESEDEDEDPTISLSQVLAGQNGDPRIPNRQPSLATSTTANAQHHDFAEFRKERTGSANNGRPMSTEPGSHSEHKTYSGEYTPSRIHSPIPDHLKSPQPDDNGNTSNANPTPQKEPKPIRYGERPVWWLDILSPTEQEMKIISKAFGIHPLTAEDIMMQEQREKVELFRHYYFVNYRSFDQDQNSENFMEPINMYVVVFRECVLSFHFSVTPHPANVRRRIRQLRDYLILSSDWISYAIIDDITDVFGPLIQSIEDEVDDIDDEILQLHSTTAASDPYRKNPNANRDNNEKQPQPGDDAEAGRDMLRRVGDCRKKVMSLYRLLGNKADVIKGFAKRCNEHWEVAPRSEIGLYLGDIQDHIVTMTSNLSHYEKILARSHGNYLAQINIRMNERQEQTADVLGKLTVLGTIVLPMNIITGLWGMNVLVPGQDAENGLNWFWSITAGLLVFGLACFLIAKRVYNIV
ncbi:putative metal ion transporter [Triangularia verruculosa]|uniref:Metal ion transporter n=1 Tax=Triangularia verruculosa TaxID=2587418 RepID=A0AAN6XGU7_9PEZI|nr:putative metal ion transporter [Triangularia verruculosa]